MRRSALRCLAALAACATSCATGPEPLSDNQPPVVEARPDGGEPPAPPATATSDDPPPTADEHAAALERVKPAAPQPPTDAEKRLDALLGTFLTSHATRRLAVASDKPLYQPGETIWFRGVLLATATLLPAPATGVTFELVSPRGSSVMARRVASDAHGVAANDFPLPADVVGGEYTLRARADDGATDERKVIVASYEAPRLKKALEFIKKAYGPGDTVAAAVSVARPTGEPFAGRALTAVAVVDDTEVARLPVTTDGAGTAVVRFTLPAAIARGDALLTVMAEDGGVTESIQKRIPVVLKTVRLSLFPESGDLVEGLPARVYFAATNPLGKPADVAGRVVDDAGREVARFSSLHDGLGRFPVTPQRGRRYHVEITRPTGIAEHFPLPEAKHAGCALTALDDFEGKRDEVRVGVACTEARTIVLEAVLREAHLSSATAQVAAGQPAVIALPVPRGTQGAVRVTVLDDKFVPLAERLVYRGRGADLQVKVSAQKPSLSPRDPVELTVETRDGAGRPVEATVDVAVVDDTVLSFADDKSANLLARTYLEKELPDGQAATIEEPNFYFSSKPNAAAALDLVMGTRGWRHFEWQLVLAPPPPATRTVSVLDGLEGAIGGVPGGVMAARAQMAPRPMAMAAPAATPPVDKAERAAAPAHRLAEEAVKEKGVLGVLAREEPFAGKKNAFGGGFAGRERDRRAAAGDDEVALEQQQLWTWAPVRQFPVPDYSHVEGTPVRTDFRETIYWNPSVSTDRDGRAKVKFYLSDAVTSFRATVEGASAGGMLGRGEAVVQSKLPLSLEAKIPVEVSAGDTIRLPVTLANETDHALDATLTAKFGAAFKLVEDPSGAPVHLDAGERRALFFPLEVVATDGESEILLATDTAGLHDEVKRAIRVVPLGFPAHAAFSGTVRDRALHTIDLETALPRTLTATVTMYPSPLATLVKGADGILREPGGCFEQTSSSNYPNTMAAQYLLAHDVSDPALVQKIHGLLERGYKRLTGYESPKHGYEWFGGDPGHEALTAYGMMEFADMEKVYGDVDRTMIDRTAKWLSSRRDGKGGYLRNPRALDSFGGAPPEVTNAYITWALTEAGKPYSSDLGVEIEASRKLAAETSDPYLLALAANTLENVKDAAAGDAIARLASKQGKDGGFPGAKTSITRSGGEALAIETASLAVLALGKAQGHDGEERAAVEWLTRHDNGYGAYGSTQSTVLALRALSAYAERSRQAQSGGVATVFVNGKQAGRIAYDKGRKEPLVFDDLAGAMVRGRNAIEIRVDSQAALPYAVAIDWRTRMPSSSPEAKVRVETVLAKQSVRMGESVRLTARVESMAPHGEGLPMALARVGLPGGLSFQTWQLKELRDKGVIDFYETRPREVILYFRALAPAAKKEIALDLLATVPGTYVGPASSAYLYYTNEHKTWAQPLEVNIAPYSAVNQ